MQRVLSGLIFACLVLVVLLPGLKATTTVNAEVPWETGDEWALGLEIDLYEELKDELQLAEDELEGESSIRNLDWDLQGLTGYYQKGKVVNSESEEFYRVESEAAYYLHSLIDFSVEAKLPRADHYEHVDEDDLVDLRWKEITYQQTGDFVVRGKTVSLFRADNYELEQVEVTLTVATESTVEATNLPNIEYGDEEYDPSCDCYIYEYIDVSYIDTGQSSEGLVTAGLTSTYEPALRVYDFPISAESNWYDTTNVTLSGYLYGELDMSEPEGLSASEMELFYEGINDFLAELELDYSVDDWSDLFPLHFPSAWMLPSDPAVEDEELALLYENVTIDGDRFVFGPVTTGPISYHFATGEMTPVETPGGVEVYAVPYRVEDMDEITSRGHDDDYDDDEPTTYISTASGRPVKYTTTIPDWENGMKTLEVAPVTPAEATRQMEAKASISNPAKGGYVPEEPPGVLSWLVLLMVLSVALAGGGAYAYRRRQGGSANAPVLEPVNQPVQQPIQQSYYQTPGVPASGYGYPTPQTDPYAHYRNPASQEASTPYPPAGQYPPQAPIGACPSCGGSYQITDYHSVLACPHCGFHIPAMA